MRREKDRRAFRRLTEKHKVRVTVVSCPEEASLKGRSFSGTTRDISVGGIKFYARRPLPVGTALEVRLELSRPLEVLERSGRVIWSQNPGSNSRVIVGVNFTDKAREAVMAWRRMLDRRC